MGGKRQRERERERGRGVMKGEKEDKETSTGCHVIL